MANTTADDADDRNDLQCLEKVAEYIAAEPDRRGWNAYDLDEFFDLLVSHCDEKCVLDGVDLMVSYKSRIPQLSGRKLVAILGKYESGRAQELRVRYRESQITSA